MTKAAFHRAEADRGSPDSAAEGSVFAWLRPAVRFRSNLFQFHTLTDRERCTVTSLLRVSKRAPIRLNPFFDGSQELSFPIRQFGAGRLGGFPRLFESPKCCPFRACPLGLTALLRRRRLRAKTHRALMLPMRVTLANLDREREIVCRNGAGEERRACAIGIVREVEIDGDLPRRKSAEILHIDIPAGAVRAFARQLIGKEGGDSRNLLRIVFVRVERQAELLPVQPEARIAHVKELLVRPARRAEGPRRKLGIGRETCRYPISRIIGKIFEALESLRGRSLLV